MNKKECASALLSSDEILLITHRNPDGDTLGSAAALCLALRRKGKKAYLFPNPGVTEKYTEYVAALLAPDGCEAKLVVSVDVATPGLFPEGFEGKVDLAIDHHPTNSGFARKSLIWADKASCGEIVLELIKTMCGKPTAQEASLLYMAVSTDTGCFQYSNTNSSCLRSAAELLDYGADNTALNTKLFRKISKARMKLEGKIYESMSFHRGGTVVVATVTQAMLRECGATKNDLDDLAGLAGKAEGGIVSITIRETEEGGSKVSVRSTKDVSSSAICAYFGGGGHAMASGCTIAAAPEKAKELLLAVVDEVWK